ncbi:MAG: von Willebrand factor type A domain-containing protein [Verrucomicrobiia bacterium]|jgi:Ca-activated chloride channel family protein
MKIDPHDPRLTAHALGELDDAERADLEALLQDDETARREVETIRRAATVLTDKLQSEPCPRLNPGQVAEIERRFRRSDEDAPAIPWMRVLGWGIGLAGTAAILAALMLPALNRATVRPRQFASQEVRLEPQPSATAESDFRFSRVGTVPPSKPVGIAVVQPPPMTKDQLAMNSSVAQPLGNEPDVVLNSAPTESSSSGAIQRYYRTPVMNERPADGIMVYRGAEGRVIPLDEPKTAEALVQQPKPMRQISRIDKANDMAGNVAYNDGHVGWQDNPSSRVEIYWTSSSPDAESYPHSIENSFLAVTQNPLSTFSLDVDTASYANIRRFLNQGTLPPRDAVRIEEMLNYFPYDYPAPRRGEPFSLYVEMAECPWNSAHRLALVALKAKDVAPRKAQPMNLVFLIDASGSMADANKLPLVKQALRLLVEQLSARDHVAIVIYAGDSRVALPSTSGDDKEAILEVIDSLEANGSTNGGAGIQSAYREATAHFIEGGVNRVILCTDGDFNVGITDPNQLVRLIQQQMKSGVFLSVFGFGMGNLKDSTMQKLADKGNGNYAYIDNLDEAHKALVEQMRGTLVTVAKDAKVQIEFNPALVQSYRLIGYEKRMLRAQDFNNDRKDAGDVGAGHTVTALYEIVPAGVPTAPGVDPLKYQSQPSPRTAFGDELMTVKLRYKDLEASSSQLLTAPVRDQSTSWRGTSDDFRFAASVAAFGMVLRNSPYKGAANFDLVLQLAEGARGRDANGYRGEFISLVDQARALRGNVVPADP